LELRYVTQSDAARLFGVKRQAIARAMEPGRPLEMAKVRRDGKVLLDMRSDAAMSYRTGPDWSLLNTGPAETSDTSGTPESLPEDVRKYWSWTLSRCIRVHGTLRGFADLLTAMAKVEQIEERKLRRKADSGTLVSKELVKQHVFSLVERTNIRLIQDLPVALAIEVHQQCKAGATVEEIQGTIMEAVSTEMEMTKKEVARGIRRATGKMATK
jgi:predicted DNA-binding protein (UPF0251 family)